MFSFKIDEVKENLTLENIFELLDDWGGEPEYTSFGILSATICHNLPGEGSRKLYYYENSKLFKCYTGCDDIVDIFGLLQKVEALQHNREIDVNEAVRIIAYRFGLLYEMEEDAQGDLKDDWALFHKYSQIAQIEPKEQKVVLQEYDKNILDHLNYSLRLEPWLREGISQEAIERARIGYYLGGDQITIPHFDIDGRFIGLRGRTMCKEDAERFGKYRPVRINKQIYNHPLGLNLYNLNNSKENIRQLKKAIVLESEKSCLQYASYFGADNDISVACCGSSLSNYQVHLLLSLGIKELIIGFDRQFEEIGDEEFKHLTNNLKKINEKYKSYVLVSFIFDKNKITGYKSSPTDEGPEKFLQLFKERIII